MARPWSRTRVLPRCHTGQSQWCTQVHAVGRAKEQRTSSDVLLWHEDGVETHLETVCLQKNLVSSARRCR